MMDIPDRKIGIVEKIALLSEADFNAILREAGKPVAVLFGAAWSSSFREMRQWLGEVADALGNSVRIAAVDTDENPELTKRLRLRSLPTTALFTDGVEIARDASPMSVPEAVAWIRSKLASPAGEHEAEEHFFLAPDFLRSRGNVKWTQYGQDVLPAFVAEMDFAIAPPIQAAIKRIVENEDYGYPKRKGFDRPEHSISQAFADRMARLYGWKINRDDVQPLADLVQATYATIQAFSDEGDGVLLQTPAYPPFYEAIKDTRRVLLSVPMVSTGTRFEFDFASLEAQAGKARMIALCNPHNPVGRVLTREELTEIGRIAIAHDLVIVSDEIHSELIYDGESHTPIASISPEIAARTVTINSPTKAFNIPGLRCAVMHFGSSELRDRFLRRVPKKTLGQVSVIGIEAAVAAWRDGDAWLEKTVAHLKRMRDLCARQIAETMPKIKFIKPEATYLAWLDCSALGLNKPAAAFFAEHAKVGLSAGETFDPEAHQFVRLNFAASEPVLRDILDRMARAAAKLG